MAKKAESENARIAREIIEIPAGNGSGNAGSAEGYIRANVRGNAPGELSAHLGYESNERGEKATTNRRNGYSKKTLKTTAGNVEVALSCNSSLG